VVPNSPLGNTHDEFKNGTPARKNPLISQWVFLMAVVELGGIEPLYKVKVNILAVCVSKAPTKQAAIIMHCCARFLILLVLAFQLSGLMGL
jgi:hypothetical protein